MAPGSQEASFLTVEDEAVPTTSVSNKSVSSTLNRAGTPEEGSSSESESEEFPASRDQLKARLYSLLREKAHVPFDSPPRIQQTLSTFETSCGLSQELSSSYKSFPESKHVTTALRVIQDSLASPPGSSSNNIGKSPGFGPSSFPGRFRSKDFEIHNSSIGMSAPTSVSEVSSTVRDSHLFVSHVRQREAILLSEEVQSLILKGAIQRVRDPFQSPGFYSRLFLDPKKTGGTRPVIDLSILNTFLLIPHFKMETNCSNRSCIHPGMWTTSLDLMDAYFHIPIAPPFRKVLRFV
jgi:hypothetical protein